MQISYIQKPQTKKTSKNIFVVLLIAIAFLSVAIACWTSLQEKGTLNS
ncbi:hypothetical protein [Fortiea contorta]|nr:hypothetical protein [Fortiea contorta]